MPHQNTDVQQLAARIGALERAARFRDEIDHVARHDLKAPLNLIMGIPDLILDTADNLTPRQREQLNTIRRAARRMLDRIDLSLAQLRIEQGSHVPAPATLDLAPLLADAIETHRALARVRGCTVAVRADGAPAPASFNVPVRGERLLLLGLLSNVLHHALTAGPKDSAVGLDITSGNPVTVAITHAGVVPNARRSTFFDRPWESDAEAQPLEPYAARQLAGAQGGQIVLDTATAGQVTLRITLPGPAA